MNETILKIPSILLCIAVTVFAVYAVKKSPEKPLIAIVSMGIVAIWTTLFFVVSR